MIAMQEPWLIALITFHVLLLVSVVTLRRSWNFNLFILLAAGDVVARFDFVCSAKHFKAEL